MQAADYAAATAHLRISTNFVEQGLTRETATGQGDVSFRGSALQLTLHFQDHPASGSVARSTADLIQVDKREATRSRPHAWSCVARNSFALPVGPSVIASVVGGRTKSSYASPAATSLNGFPVWHLRQTVTAANAGAGTGTETIDYLISRAGYALLRTQVALAASVRHLGTGKRQAQKTRVTEAAQQDLSSFGEAITITLPKLCRS